MYPFKSDRKFVENRWYIAAFSSEVSREPLGRIILDVPLVLYRTEAGSPIAMYGICPHRYFPLAKGRVEGDAVVCGYHGFTFEADGKCSAVPSQGTAAGFCQPTYPVVERGPLCWIWMGKRDLADPALIPPYEDFGLAQEGWHYSSANHFVVQGRAQLLIDNLMDLTHLPYLHWHIPGGDAMKAMPMREEERECSYRLIRTGKLPWSSFNDDMWGAENRYEGLADWESVTDFYGPELIRTNMPLFTAVPGHDTAPPALGPCTSFTGLRRKPRIQRIISASPRAISGSAMRRSMRSNWNPTAASASRTSRQSKRSSRWPRRPASSSANCW